MTPLPTLFRLLDSYRHLPDYQLERRADILFAIYLPAYLERTRGVSLSPVVIPELPIKRDLIWPETPTHHSVKVDYCFSAADGSQVFFVELKTDDKSRRETQDTYLQRSQALGFRRIVEGIVDIVRVSKARQKYYHLAVALQRLGHLRLPDTLPDYLYPKPRAGLSQQLAAIEVLAPDPPIEVVYLQPTRPDALDTTDPRYIDFTQFAAFVREHPDELSQLFAASLERWKFPAGSVRPDPT